MGAGEPPKVIFFDLDDTLIYEEQTDAAVIIDVVQRLLPSLDVAASILVEAVHRSARMLWQECPASTYCRRIQTSSIEGLYGDYSGDDPNLAMVRQYIQTERYRERAWKNALDGLGVSNADAIASQLAMAYAQERARRHDAIPNADVILEQLSQSYRLVLITNGAPKIQRGKLAGSGFGPWFEAIVVSGELGVGKPDPTIFHHALRLAGVAAEAAVMVGNSLANDVIGAHNAGIRAIWFNLNGDTVPPAAPPWQTVTTLADIPVALRSEFGHP